MVSDLTYVAVDGVVECTGKICSVLQVSYFNCMKPPFYWPISAMLVHFSAFSVNVERYPTNILQTTVFIIQLQFVHEVLHEPSETHKSMWKNIL